jgi:peptide-methionine (R)-S-oxide reductase
MIERIEKTDEEWRETLTRDRFRILRGGGTEPPFDNAYWDDHDDGTYECAGCGLTLFDSADKFDSGTGWPSFSRAVDPEVVVENRDTAFGMVRTEVVCARCDGGPVTDRATLRLRSARPSRRSCARAARAKRGRA